ncbi:MAG: 12-oxophytodienoate reductase [Spirochaetaceae bacterium]
MLENPLFSSYNTKKINLTNRFVMAPMTRIKSPGGIPTADVAEYYRRRAAGEVGLIITEGTVIEHDLATNEKDIPRIAQDTEEAWRNVVDQVHNEKSSIIVQLWHQGPITRPGISALKEDAEKTDIQLIDDSDRKKVFDAFVKATVRAQDIGFDGVEFHAAHGYLLDSFIRAGQVDFVCDIVREARRLVGDDFTFCLRFSQWRVKTTYDEQQFKTPAELEAVLLPLKEAGIDIFHASTRRFWQPEFEGSDLGLAGWTKKITQSATITVGNVGLSTSEYFGSGQESQTELIRRYNNHEFDMVAVGRPLISEAEWPKKVREHKNEDIIEYSEESQKVYP